MNPIPRQAKRESTLSWRAKPKEQVGSLARNFLFPKQSWKQNEKGTEKEHLDKGGWQKVAFLNEELPLFSHSMIDLTKIFELEIVIEKWVLVVDWLNVEEVRFNETPSRVRVQEILKSDKILVGGHSHMDIGFFLLHSRTVNKIELSLSSRIS